MISRMPFVSIPFSFSSDILPCTQCPAHHLYSSQCHTPDSGRGKRHTSRLTQLLHSPRALRFPFPPENSFKGSSAGRSLLLPAFAAEPPVSYSSQKCTADDAPLMYVHFEECLQVEHKPSLYPVILLPLLSHRYRPHGQGTCHAAGPIEMERYALRAREIRMNIYRDIIMLAIEV